MCASKQRYVGLGIYSRRDSSGPRKVRGGFLEEVLFQLGPKGKIIFNYVSGTVRRSSRCRAPQQKEYALLTLSFNPSISTLVCFKY